MMRHGIRIVALAAVVALSAGAARAQRDDLYGEDRYGDRDAEQEMVDELRGLIEKAQRQRAVRPRFLRDLEDLANRHDYPWRRPIVREYFRDGDFTRDPHWRVVSGEFVMNWSGGLYSRVRRGGRLDMRRSGQDGRQSDKITGGDIAKAILGGLLNVPDRDQARDQAGRTNREPAQIFLRQRITSAFAISAAFATNSGRQDDDWGGFDFSVIDNQRRARGYRLSYTPATGLTLFRISGRNVRAIAGSDRGFRLDGRRDHVIDWSRDRDGHFHVGLDGRDILAVTDRESGRDFEGFYLINRGGEFILRSLTIDGT